MNIQAFDIAEFVLQYLPPNLRKAKLVSFIRAILTPLISFRQTLVTIVYPDLEQRARYNSQVIVFEKVLNREFLYLNSEITIDSDPDTDHVYTYRANEAHPVFLSNATEGKPVYLKNHPEYQSPWDFTVRVPLSLFNTKLPKLKATINKYKLVGTNYRIITY
jgi:hypothetical protein